MESEDGRPLLVVRLINPLFQSGIWLTLRIVPSAGQFGRDVLEKLIFGNGSLIFEQSLFRDVVCDDAEHSAARTPLDAEFRRIVPYESVTIRIRRAVVTVEIRTGRRPAAIE